MAKKLILLLLIIPIVVMILLFAATQTLSNLVDVPVTGIEILNTKEYEYLDMDQEQTCVIEYAVYPTGAKNKDVSVTTEAFGDEPLAKFEFVQEEDGKVVVVPLTAGAARIVLTTVSGGFRDSIIVYSYSTKLQAIDATITNADLLVGETAAIYTSFLPENPSDTTLEYVSSNPAVVEVNRNGVVRALSKGTATITVISEFDRSITDTIEITVSNKDVMDLGMSEVNTFSGKGNISISIESDNVITLDNLSYRILDENGGYIPESVVVAAFNINGDIVTLNYEFKDESFAGTVSVEITFTNNGESITKTCAVSKLLEIDVSFNVTGVFGVTAGMTSPIPHTLTPEDAEVTYKVSASNDNLIVKMNNNGNVVIEALKAGITEVTLSATNDAYPDQVKTTTVTVVISPKSISVTEAAREYGIEKLFTIGGYEFDVNGALIQSALGNKAFVLHFQTPTEAGEGFAENISWHSSSEEVLIDKNGVISFANNTFVGEVKFWASFNYEGVEAKTAEYTVRCVANGINVYSFADLYQATKKTENQIVLHSNIKEDFGYINGEAVYENKETPYYTEIDTTYDKTYYNNDPEAGEPKVKILIEFRNDLYGNGYIINAHNVTYKIQKNEKNGVIERIQDPNALFQGPLNFVMMREDDGATTSVKAQDNICFAIYENVNIYNVELRGCDLEGDEDGNQDLVDLDYIGTTVEVLGDNVNIAYARLTNGRTVLRAFGDIADNTKKIHINITNSVLSGAREFIMRIGSNQFVNGTDDNITPNLPGDTSSDYNAKKDYYTFTDKQKEAYDEKYINTFVTVKNSVFKDSGIFAIGMDSHFAGAALHNGRGLGAINANFEKYLGKWYDLAKTSYGAKLRFEGEVELYNWKDIEDIDSSTLIEVKGTSGFDMKLDLQNMIEAALSKEPEKFKNIITPYNGKNYVHAGIAFFGGGKNYSVFDSESKITLGHYDVSLADAGQQILSIAAGDEDFYFFIYDKTSAFTPQLQQERLADKSAYDCIYK